jgi:hypothetical protein
MSILMPSLIEELLAALGELLDADAGTPIDLVICGGTALNVQGIVNRPPSHEDLRFALTWCLAQQDGLTPDLHEALHRLGAEDLARSLE